MSQFIYYQKQAWSNLQKKTAFVAAVVITMGTTLGALLCALTLGHLLLVEPLPYPEQDKLYRVSHLMDDNKGEISANAFTYPGMIHLYKNQNVFDETALMTGSQDVLTSLPHQPRMRIGFATPSWFSLLGTEMALGRAFESTEAVDTFNPVAIISHDTWVNEFNRSPDILQQKMTFRGISYSIVGVLSSSFVEPQLSANIEQSVWLPWDYNRISNKDTWGNISGALIFIGKIKEGISESQAEQTLTPLVFKTWKSNVIDVPFFDSWTVTIDIQSFKEVIIGDSGSMVISFITGVLGLVIIACANIANLFMSRTAEQQRQLAIFAAIGAKKSHLFRVLLSESSLLMMISVIVALVIATTGFQLLQTQFEEVLPRMSELTLNWFTFIAAIFFAALFAVTFALISSKMINYRALNSLLQSSGKGTGIQVSKRFRQVLIVAQVSIATVLVFASIGLFNESMRTIKEPLGFEVENMVAAIISSSTTESPTEEDMAAAMTSLKANLLNLPQVKSVSQSDSPLSEFSLSGLTDPTTDRTFTPNYKFVDADYFKQIRQPLIEGNYISEVDVKDSNQVAVVNDVFAKNLRDDGNVIGMKLDASGDTYTIIGIVKAVKLPAQVSVPNRIYYPATLGFSEMNLTLEPNQSITREQVVSAIKDVSNSYALFDLQMLPQTKSNLLVLQRTTAATTAALAIITLFLASIGLYGILSYGTQMRRFEIGTRMAIGAKRLHLIKMIVKENSSVITVGILVSLVAMLVIYVLNKETLVGYVDINLVPAFMATLLAIGSLALFACYWPLRKYINNPAIHLLRGSD